MSSRFSNNSEDEDKVIQRLEGNTSRTSAFYSQFNTSTITRSILRFLATLKSYMQSDQSSTTMSTGLVLQWVHNVDWISTIISPEVGLNAFCYQGKLSQAPQLYQLKSQGVLTGFRISPTCTTTCYQAYYLDPARLIMWLHGSVLR